MPEHRGTPPHPQPPRRAAIFVERGLQEDNVGVQNEIHAAHGSLNRYEFRGDSFAVCPDSPFAPTLDAIN